MESGFPTKPEESCENNEVQQTLTSTANDHRTPNNSRLRLIPLTAQILEAMMDFNGPSYTSSQLQSEGSYYKTLPIANMVRDEVQSTLQELCIGALVERCLREKLNMDVQDGNGQQSEGTEIEATVELINDNGKNELIVENFQILDQRITNLEERISTLLQTVPKLRQVLTKRFKINTKVLLRDPFGGPGLHKVDSVSFAENPLEEGMQDSEMAESSTLLRLRENINPYDDVYYALRQNEFNMLNYKKSIATLELNQRPHFNPFIKPVGPRSMLRPLGFKKKQRSTFISQ